MENARSADPDIYRQGFVENAKAWAEAEGVPASAGHHDLDLIVYATGFDAITGGYDRIDIRGVDGQRLRDKWRESPSTYLGLLSHGFPNLLMVAGPQSASGSTNFPRAIETGVNWVTGLVQHALDSGCTRIEARPDAEEAWVAEVQRAPRADAVPAVQGLVHRIQLQRRRAPGGQGSLSGLLRWRTPVLDGDRPSRRRRVPVHRHELTIGGRKA